MLNAGVILFAAVFSFTVGWQYGVWCLSPILVCHLVLQMFGHFSYSFAPSELQKTKITNLEQTDRSRYKQTITQLYLRFSYSNYKLNFAVKDCLVFNNCLSLFLKQLQNFQFDLKVEIILIATQI